MDIKNLKLESISLSNNEKTELSEVMKKIIDKGISYEKASKLSTLYENIYKYSKILEATSIRSADIEPFKAISITATTRLYKSNIIDTLASVQPLQTVAGYIYYFDYKYANDFVNEDISAGDKLSDKRTTEYSYVAEGQPLNEIGLEVKSELIEAKVRGLNISWSLHSYLNLSSILGQDGAMEKLNTNMLNLISKKLRDEVELKTIKLIEASVKPEHKVEFTVNSQDCQTAECQAKKLWKTIQEASSIIYRKYAVMPNVMIIGDKAKSILDSLDRPVIIPDAENKPSGVGRLILGTIDTRYTVIYEPSVKGVIMIYKEMETEYGATVVYAPYIPLALSEPFVNPKTLETVRGVFTVDAVKVVHPEFIAKVEII